MTVLCVDTNRIVLYGLKKKVNKILPDAYVHTCQNSKEALQIVEKKGCDVLITEIDLGREKEEGIQLAQKVMDMNPQVNIIFATAISIRGCAQQVVKIRYSGYLTKPYTKEELKEELCHLRFPTI